MVVVAADSAANLPDALARRLRITTVPMYLKFGQAAYRDGLDMAPDDFYARLLRDQEPASTAAPSPGDFLEAFKATGADEVVCVTVASTMSASHQAARLAAERFGGLVEVIDSRGASMAEGFVALAAARAAAAGHPLAEVASRARAAAARARLVATVDTFEFLLRSGRVNKLQAYAATVLDIKPVFAFRDGEASAVARPRTRRRALERVADEVGGRAGGRPIRLALLHAAAEPDALELGRLIGGRVEILERHVVEVTPVIGAHTGPGLVGAAFCQDDLGVG